MVFSCISGPVRFLPQILLNMTVSSKLSSPRSRHPTPQMLLTNGRDKLVKMAEREERLRQLAEEELERPSDDMNIIPTAFLQVQALVWKAEDRTGENNPTQNHASLFRSVLTQKNKWTYIQYWKACFKTSGRIFLSSRSSHSWLLYSSNREISRGNDNSKSWIDSQQQTLQGWIGTKDFLKFYFIKHNNTENILTPLTLHF